MIKQLRIKRLVSLLIIGEIMTILTGILSHMSTEEVMYMIVGFAVLWIIYILSCVWVDSLVKE